MIQKTDRELVIQARSGDREAFGELYERYQHYANRIALRLVASEDIAQELSQEAMLQAYLSLDRLRQEERFRSWLFGILLNICKGYLRGLKRQISPLPGSVEGRYIANGWSVNPVTNLPDEIAAEREWHRRVLSAVEELPPSQRDATLLYYYDSLTLQEVAALTGLSVGAVKVRLHRARNQLRENLVPALTETERVQKDIRRRKPMVEASVVDIVRQDEKHIVVLQDKAAKRMLHIWVGPAEGGAIALGLHAYPTPRPMTFNFVASILEAFGAHLEEARIEALKDSVFYGVARLRAGDQIKEIDARPSDVLALAVRTGSPILVSEEVMDKAGKEMTSEEREAYTSGEGAAAILKEFEEMMKKIKSQLSGPELDQESK